MVASLPQGHCQHLILLIMHTSVYISIYGTKHACVCSPWLLLGHLHLNLLFLASFSSTFSGLIGISIHKSCLVVYRALDQRRKNQDLIFSPAFFEPACIQCNRNILALVFKLQHHQNHLETLTNTSFQDSLTPYLLIQQI